MPNLTRFHQLRAREDASRRATQLAYATHIFKAQNGHFPKTLDELGDEYGAEIRIDPFSGQFFGYELTKDGPRIYSVSENGKSDGGVHSPRWDDNTKEGSEDKPASDDYVFWPPQPK